MQGQSGDSSAPNITATTPLIKISVPGSGRNAFDPPGTQLNPLLNPETSAPVFAPSSIYAQQCAPETLTNAVYLEGTDFVDRAQFSKVMTDGAKLASDRHIWDFNVTRLKKQHEVVSGFAARISPNVLERLRREDILYQQQLAVWQKAVDDYNRVQWENRNSPQNSRRQAPPNIKGPTVVYTVGHSIPRNIEEIRFNASVLDAQNAALQIGEKRYVEQLLGIYKSAFARYITLVQAKTSMELLGRFDRFRDKNIVACLTRGMPSLQIAEKLLDADTSYPQVARQVVAASRLEIQSAFAGIKTPSEYELLFRSIFPSTLLQTIAMQDAQIKAMTDAKKAEVVAREAREIEEKRQIAAAALARKQAAELARYRDNARRNLAPSSTELAELLTTYLADELEVDLIGRTERTSNSEFKTFAKVPFMGTVFLGSRDIKIDQAQCTAASGGQRCTIKFRDILILPSVGNFTLDPFSRPGEHTAMFRWTDTGLSSTELKATIIAEGKARRAANAARDIGGSPYSTGDNLQDAFVQRNQENQQRYYDRNLRSPYDASRRY